MGKAIAGVVLVICGLLASCVVLGVVASLWGRAQEVSPEEHARRKAVNEAEMEARQAAEAARAKAKARFEADFPPEPPKKPEPVKVAAPAPVLDETCLDAMSAVAMPTRTDPLLSAVVEEIGINPIAREQVLAYVHQAKWDELPKPVRQRAANQLLALVKKASPKCHLYFRNESQTTLARQRLDGSLSMAIDD